MADPTFEELGTRSFGTLSLMSSGNSGALNLATSTLGDLALASLSDLAGSVYGGGSSGSGGQEPSGSPLFKPVWVTSSQLSSLSRIAGQFIAVTDTGDIYVDTNTTRVHLANIPVASTVTVGGVKVDGTSITITNGTISATDRLVSLKTPANAGKYLTINSAGEIVATSMPSYNGEAIVLYGGEVI